MDLTRGSDAICAGHDQIHEHYIGLVERSHLHGLGAIGSFTDQFQVFVDHEEF
jgi:hypothetical protein